MQYRIWHGENETYVDARTVVASSAEQAASSCLFNGGGELRLRSAPNHRWIATRSASDDYYFIEEHDAQEGL